MVPVFVEPLVPWPAVMPWGPPPVYYGPGYAAPAPQPVPSGGSADGGASPYYDVPTSAPIAVRVESGNFGPELPIDLDVDDARRAPPAEIVAFLDKTAETSAGARACKFDAAGIRADPADRPRPYPHWRATPAHAAPSGGRATLYWVQLDAGDRRCLAYRQVVGERDVPEAARDSIEDVLSGLAALGVTPELTAGPTVRVVERDPRQLLDLVDLL